MFNISCRNDDPVTPPVSKGAYENGILIANEGGFSSPNASVSFISNDLAKLENNIFSSNNDNATLGNVFQSIGFRDDKAYLVANVPNKIEIVNRYTFKKAGTITANLETPRYIAFSPNNIYVTNNDFFSVRKVNIYDNSNNFVKSISFDRYAEKVTYSDGFVYVQTDGITYDNSYNELPTGHTITRINASSNTVDKTITLSDDAIIKDMASDNAYTYVLTSDSNKTVFHKIMSKTGTVETSTFSGVANGLKLALDNGKIYFVTGGKKVYEITGITAKPMFDVTASHIYGFNVIDGKVYVSDPSFSQNNQVRIYDLSGSVLKTVTTGIGTNGFYKN